MIFRKRKSAEQGFTLIEVVIVTGIFSVLMLAMLNLFDWHNKVYFLEQADTQATGSARTTMNNMDKYIAQASSVESSRTVSGTTYTTDSDTLVLKLPAFDSSDNLLTNIYDYVVYYKTGNSLYQLIDLGSGSGRNGGTKLMSAYAQTLTFTYDAGDVTQATRVTVDLQAQATSRGASTTTAHVTDTIFLRNK
ncbi:MAG TPA: prepilin-type N-terminal cleavage/methylation domain-containing protein [Patescibacteria group bacterium]|jgi:prepilin-type N-terminal cleavage/methylation domain-containing protein|nr:prepilin-type N-terminal cleavage/methylation domain-containing protein [Patescibacteria group bacterium]